MQVTIAKVIGGVLLEADAEVIIDENGPEVTDLIAYITTDEKKIILTEIIDGSTEQELAEAAAEAAEEIRRNNMWRN